ncbi:MAG: universal stress protein [Pseudomonadota bacterium]
MSYANVMVHVQPGRSNAALLEVAGELASRFKADVIGIAACQPMQAFYGEGYVNPESIDIDRNLIAAQLHEAEAEFRAALKTQAGALDWRTSVSPLPIAQIVAREARSADVVITSSGISGLSNHTRRADTSDLVMQVGRPVLIVPHNARSMKLQRVVVFWKDSRETRRAIADALPLLMKAPYVAVVMLVPEDETLAGRMQLDAVVAWLKRHGIECWSVVVKAERDDVTQLKTIAEEQEADVIVAGAYGHSRFHEWALGGVTRDLLLHSDRCALLSH